jgi:hypothetical protein
VVARREDDVVGVRIVTVVAFAAVVAGVLSGSATAAPTRDALVRPGEGIGKVQLGMTLGTALRSLRRPVVFVRAEIFPRESLRYLEYRTKDHQWRIGVFGIRGRERVALVRTGVRRERTREGVGVGTPVPMVASRLRPYRPVCNKRYPVVGNVFHIELHVSSCAIRSRSIEGSATTSFGGKPECAVPQLRYQGCPRIVYIVRSVAVESNELARYGLAWWSADTSDPLPPVTRR